MLTKLKTFIANDAGAVTVDWVVLCAAIVVLCVAGVDKAKEGVDSLASALEQGISVKSVDNGD